MPVGLGLGRDHEPHYGRREGMVLMPYDPLWVGQLAGLHTLEGQDCGTGGRPTGYSLYERQYSFRRQPEVTQRGKGVTTQTCFLPRGRRAQVRSVGEGASPCQANLGVFHGRLLRHEAYGRRVRALQGEGRGFPLTFCLFVCLFLSLTIPILSSPTLLAKWANSPSAVYNTVWRFCRYHLDTSWILITDISLQHSLFHRFCTHSCLFHPLPSLPFILRPSSHFGLLARAPSIILSYQSYTAS